MSYAIVCHTSPACARVLERLECHGEATGPDLAAAVHMSYAYCKGQVMPALMKAGVIRVVGHVRNHAGPALAIYALGPGPSVPKPAAVETAVRMRLRRRQMDAALGPAARTVRRSLGAVVRDGQRLRTAGFGRTAGEVVRGEGVGVKGAQ